LPTVILKTALQRRAEESSITTAGSRQTTGKEGVPSGLCRQAGVRDGDLLKAVIIENAKH